MQLRFKDIMTRISEYIKSEMYDYFTSLPSDAEQRAFVKKVMHDDPDECTELLDKVTYVDEFETVLDNRKDIWVDSMKIYLDSCVKTVYLSQIRVSASQRGRAIDIYENLNMGGVSGYDYSFFQYFSLYATDFGIPAHHRFSSSV